MVGQVLYWLVPGFCLVAFSFFAYLLIFAEVSRRRRRLTLNSEYALIYFGLFGGIMMMIFWFLTLVKVGLEGNTNSLPDLVQKGLNAVIIFCGITGSVAVVGGIVVAAFRQYRGLSQ